MMVIECRDNRKSSLAPCTNASERRGKLCGWPWTVSGVSGRPPTSTFTSGSAAGRHRRIMQTNYLRDEIELWPCSTYVEVTMTVKRRRERERECNWLFVRLTSFRLTAIERGRYRGLPFAFPLVRRTRDILVMPLLRIAKNEISCLFINCGLRYSNRCGLSTSVHCFP